MKEIRVYKSPWKATKLILLSSIFVALGIWGISNNMPTWISWASIGFFGLGLAIDIFHLFDRRPQIIVNELGIFDRTTSKDFINWEIIRDTCLVDINKQKFICLIVDEEFKPSRKKKQISSTGLRLNEVIGA